MKKFIPRFIIFLGAGSLGVIIFVLALLFLSENFAGAGHYKTQISVENSDA